MKKIPLTQGQFALVDDSDFEFLSQWKWCARKDHNSGNFYASRWSPQIKGKRRIISMHRQILGLEQNNKQEGDHWDHDTLNNQRYNLRICTHKQNMMNRKSPLNTSSQFKGVCWDKFNKKWMAYIKIDGKRKNLGRFKSEEEAALVYDLAAIKYCGEFAYLNFQLEAV